MKQWKNISNESKINKFIWIIRIGILIFSSISICNEIFINFYNIDFRIRLILLLCFQISIVFWIIWHIMIKILGYSYSKKIRMSDNLMFIIIISVLIIITNTYGNYFKYFLTLVIISSTIEVSVEFGTFITVVSSVIILCIDLTYKPITSVNYYFRNDLILIVVFMLLAWPILCYIRIIDNSIKKKNHQLMILNSEIEKKDEQNKEMEKYVMTNKVCYNLFIKNSYEAILIHHFDKLIFANESATKLLGVKKTSSLISKSIYSFFPKEDNEKIKTQFKQIYEEKNIKAVFEHRILNYDNILINIENTSAFFIYEGKATILSVFRNISAEKQVKQLQRDIQKNSKLLEESRKSNKEIMEFFVNISHELKTPLNLIFSSLQMINLYNQHKDGYIEKRSNYVKIIKNNSYRLLKLINNLLDSTKTDNGFSKLHFENKNIISFVEDVTLSVAYYAESKGIRLIFDTDVEEKNMAFDCDKVERIILNLLSNSVKFTNSGGEIYVNIKDGKDYIVISVKDTGIGIPKDKQKVIFEKFGQVDKTLSRNKEGTGLGLSIVKSFVELHGGNIKVKSEIGKGSEFIVKLPVKHIKSSKENKTFFETDTERINIEFSDI